MQQNYQELEKIKPKGSLLLEQPSDGRSEERSNSKMEDLSSSLDSEDFKEEDPQKRMAKMADAIAELECYIESLGGKMLMCRRCLSASKEVEMCARCGDHRCEWCKADRSDAACLLCGRWICEGCRRMKVCQICGFG
jgi:hypothetical protein